MINPSSLTYKQKILLYLRDHRDQDDREEKQENITQKGISQNVGISRTHLSRVLSSLSEQGLIKEELAPVAGHDRKMKTYSLASQGFEISESILDELSETSIEIIQGEKEKTVPLTKVEEETDGKLDLLKCISLLEEENEQRIDLREQGIFEPVKMIGNIPSTEEFYGRDEELERMERWIESDRSVLVVLGRKGYGASSLTAKFIRNLEERHVLWINLEGKTNEKIKTRISNFLEKIGAGSKKIMDELPSHKAVAVFDDYYEIGGDVVSFLQDFLDQIEKSDPFKMIVTGREGTPIYERFYRTGHIEEGIVEELKVSPLDREDAEKILKKDIKDEALDRIMMFTKGSPQLLKLLQQGDEEKLCELTPWEKEQISLLMYLKTETKN
ncbi:MAG: helix-turn-helix domain-containing protein [Candidatus Natronoplasma sp.]